MRTRACAATAVISGHGQILRAHSLSPSATPLLKFLDQRLDMASFDGVVFGSFVAQVYKGAFTLHTQCAFNPV